MDDRAASTASPPASAAAASTEAVVQLRQLGTRFGDKVVHQGLDLEVRRGEILALVGGSGSGKSTLLREMIALQHPDSGSVRVLGVDLAKASAAELLALRLRWGVMFQHGGLFAALTLLENVGLPLREHRRLPDAEVDARAAEKIALSGLPPEAGALYPAQLSGGMQKRASLARALALEPELLFLDEPTAGLDPDSADGVDALVLELRQRYGLTVVMVTHDLDSLWGITDRVALLAEHRVQGPAPMAELARMEVPAVQEFFGGARARAAAGRHPAAPTTGANPWKPK
jgi:phospholipid/cholesterol/gamma-HCH transport system ATP-binding protein